MSQSIEVIAGSRFLTVKVTGVWTQEIAKQAIDRARAEGERLGQFRIFFDLGGFFPPQEEMTRFYSGVYIAEVLRAPFRVAAFANSEYITRFAETAAVNRGALFAIFGDRQAALAWLLEGHPPSGG